MNGIKFIAAKHILVLPSKKNPKVYLAIDTPEIARLSFKLYNPFSLLGKFLKSATQFLCINFNSAAKLISPTVSVAKSDFIYFLEKELGVLFTVSVYCATAKDKVVLQLVTDNKIFGYLKFPQNAQGVSRLTNEREAIEKLSQLHIVPNLIYSNNYESQPFIVLKNIEGVIGDVERVEYSAILAMFKKPLTFKLKNHPRVISILDQLITLNLSDLAIPFQKEIDTCDTYFSEVYEHGDFAPWNMIRTENGLVPFDFEYFVEIGLEYMDEIKYCFQISKLLNGLNGELLINAIVDNIKVDEARLMIHIFLLKEIALKTKDGEVCDFEKQLLLNVIDEKA